MSVFEHRSHEAVDTSSLHFRYANMERKTDPSLYNFAELELHHLDPVGGNESKKQRGEEGDMRTLLVPSPMAAIAIRPACRNRQS